MGVCESTAAQVFASVPLLLITVYYLQGSEEHHHQQQQLRAANATIGYDMEQFHVEQERKRREANSHARSTKLLDLINDDVCQSSC